MTITARSIERFPSVSGKASCTFHASEGVICTPMDCEYYRVAPLRDPSGKHAAALAEDFAVARAKEMLAGGVAPKVAEPEESVPPRPKPTKRSPNAKKKR